MEIYFSLGQRDRPYDHPLRTKTTGNFTSKYGRKGKVK